MSLDHQSAWTRFWNNGFTECLPGDRAAGHLVALDDAWKQFFLSLQDGARLLDLATGGGDVVRRAHALSRRFSITGVDLADLSVVGTTLSGVQLVGNTDLSRLPFADATFDAVTSQFGIEYAELAAATREAVRVLAPGGRGCFVLHHADSPTTGGVARSLAASCAVFPDGSAFQAARALFQLRERAAADADMARAESELRGAVQDLQSRLRSGPEYGPPAKAVALLANLLRAPASIPAQEALRRIDNAEQQIEASNLRRTAQLHAALNRDGVQGLASCLAEAGAAVDPATELRFPRGEVMAWKLAFRKEAQ